MRLFSLALVFAFGLLSQTFDQAVQPVLVKNCAGCHQDRLASGGFNATPDTNAASLAQRDDWERIIQRMRTGEMPPKGAPKPAAAESNGLINFVEAEFARADKLAGIGVSPVGALIPYSLTSIPDPANLAEIGVVVQECEKLGAVLVAEEGRLAIVAALSEVERIAGGRESMFAGHSSISGFREAFFS